MLSFADDKAMPTCRHGSPLRRRMRDAAVTMLIADAARRHDMRDMFIF